MTGTIDFFPMTPHLKRKKSNNNNKQNKTVHTADNDGDCVHKVASRQYRTDTK